MADLNAFIAKTQDTKNSTPALRFYICSKVEEVLERRTTTMPDRLESYVSFCDLSFVIRHSNDKVWHTFCLKGEIMIFEKRTLGTSTYDSGSYFCSMKAAFCISSAS